MTPEEKANKYAEETILALYSDSELMQDFVKKQKKYAKIDFLAGYNEAMRWRDPIDDPPKCNDLMQIKYGDIFSNIIDYGHDRYLEDMGMWDIEQLANIKVLAWRPIK